MTAPPQPSKALSGASSARKLAADLECLYPLVVMARGGHAIEWASRGWSDAYPGASPLAEWGLGDAIRRLRPPEQIFPLLTSLNEAGTVPHALLQLDAEHGYLDVTLFALPVSDEKPAYFLIGRTAHPTPDFVSHPLLESHPDAMIVVDEQGFIVHTNPATDALLGTAPRELIGSAAVVVASEVASVTRLAAALCTDDPTEVELSLRRSNRQTVTVTARIAPHRDAEGRDQGNILSLREPPSDGRAAVELTRRNAELEHCINALAHDLRSPLVALLGFSRLLRQDYGEQLDDTGTHFVDRIEQAGRTMEALIHDLLELSRIGQPGDGFPALVDPGAVLAQLRAELKPRLDQERIRLVLPDSPPLVYCDRTRLYQVLSNLIGNAVEHMGECESRTVNVEIHEEVGLHQITVRDHGCGIDRKYHERIFEPFQSLVSRRGGRSGTGMGLAIVRKIAETHGGRAWVESPPGGGAAFHITLPQV